MRKNIFLFSLFMACWGLVACNEIDIVDGHIPAQYLEQAKALEGAYVGQMNLKPVTLNVVLDGDRLLLTASPDMIGEGCRSNIGDLKKVRAKQDGQSYMITAAIFDFDPNLCTVNVEGRGLTFGVRTNNGKVELTANILNRTEWRNECHVECHQSTPHGGVVCHQVCQYVPYSYYLSGKFVKNP